VHVPEHFDHGPQFGGIGDQVDVSSGVRVQRRMGQPSAMDELVPTSGGGAASVVWLASCSEGIDAAINLAIRQSESCCSKSRSGALLTFLRRWGQFPAIFRTEKESECFGSFLHSG
jgi:hypothetical protein